MKLVLSALCLLAVLGCDRDAQKKHAGSTPGSPSAQSSQPSSPSQPPSSPAGVKTEAAKKAPRPAWELDVETAERIEKMESEIQRVHNGRGGWGLSAFQQLGRNLQNELNQAAGSTKTRGSAGDFLIVWINEALTLAQGLVNAKDESAALAVFDDYRDLFSVYHEEFRKAPAEQKEPPAETASGKKQ